MKRIKSSSSYTSSSEYDNLSKSTNFQNGINNFCLCFGYEFIEVVSSLETILADDFEEALIDETMKENIVTRKIMSNAQPQGGDCCFETKHVREKRPPTQSPLLENNLIAKRKKSFKLKKDPAKVGTRKIKLESLEVDTSLDYVNDSFNKNVHEKFAMNTKSSDINQRLNNMDLYMQRFNLHVSREFEAHKSMTRDAISSLSEQFAESFEHLNSIKIFLQSLNP